MIKLALVLNTLVFGVLNGAAFADAPPSNIVQFPVHFSAQLTSELAGIVQNCIAPVNNVQRTVEQKKECIEAAALERSATALENWERGWRNIHTEIRAFMARTCANKTFRIEMHQCLRDVLNATVEAHSTPASHGLSTTLVAEAEEMVRVLAGNTTPAQFMRSLQTIDHIFVPIITQYCGRNPEILCLQQVAAGLNTQLGFAYSHIKTALTNSVAVAFFLAECEKVAGAACYTDHNWGDLRWSQVDQIRFSPYVRTRLGHDPRGASAQVTAPPESDGTPQPQPSGVVPPSQPEQEVRPPGDSEGDSTLEQYCAHDSDWQRLRTDRNLSVRRAAMANLYYCKINMDSQLKNDPELVFLSEVGALLFSTLDNRLPEKVAEIGPSLQSRHNNGMVAALAGPSREFLQEFLYWIESHKDEDAQTLARTFDVTQNQPAAISQMLNSFCGWVREIELSSADSSPTEGFPMILRGQSICPGVANPGRTTR